jgi:menaquinone-dependent protoporphyrinogen oxidase
MTQTPSGPVLVAYASAAGSTRGIAEFVADRLKHRGLAVQVLEVDQVGDLEPYRAVVLGSAVHDRAWLQDAEKFVRRSANSLRTRPVWMFSVGIGPSLRGPIGAPAKRLVPPRIAKLRDTVRPHDIRGFAGVVPRKGNPLLARLLLRLMGGRYGDLRDWSAIEDWADGIARDLLDTPPEATS